MSQKKVDKILSTSKPHCLGPKSQFFLCLIVNPKLCPNF